jgi:CRP-like cAMP-binding protein
LIGPELKQFAVFADLSESEQEEVAAQLVERRLDPGETLFQEGEEGNGLVLVASGSLRLASRRHPEPATVQAGASLGGLSLFAIGVREITVVAVEAARVFVLPRAGYRRLVADCPRAACRLAETLLGEVAGSVRSLVDQVAAAVDPVRSDP